MELRPTPRTRFPDIRLNQDLPEERSVDLLQVARLVRRRLKLAAAIVIAGTALAAFLALYVLPRFTAKALLIVGGDDTIEASQPTDALLDTQISAITSEANLAKVYLSISQKPELKAAVPRLQDLERHLKVMQELKSRLIAVTFTTRSSAIAAQVANLVVTLYMQSLARQRSQYASDAYGLLVQRSSQLRRELAQAEQQLSAGRSSLTAQTQDAALEERISDLRRQLDAVQLDQTLIEIRQGEHQKQELLFPSVRIFSLAIPPEEPSSTKPIFIILPASLASLILAVWLTILMGRLSPKMRSAEEAAEALGIPCIGAIPRARRIRKSGPFDCVSTTPKSPYAEAIRSVVITSLVIESCRRTTVFVTSSVSGEGKTTFASSFAVYASQLRGRALLIDLDFTRPTGLHGVPVEARGFFDVVAKRCELSEAMQPINRSGLHHLPLGRCPEDLLPILANEETSDLMRQLGEMFDLVIINGPPILETGGEAQIIAALADRILFVVRRSRTKRVQASRALRALMFPRSAQSPVRTPAISGLVFTFASKHAPARRNHRVARTRLCASATPSEEISSVQSQFAPAAGSPLSP